MSRLKRYLCLLCMSLVVGAGAADAAQATLSWDRSATEWVVGYEISYGTTPGVYTQTIDVGNATTWIVANLDALQTYYFAVRAYDALDQKSPYSAEVVKAARSLSAPDFGTVNGVAPHAADLLWQHDDGVLSVWYMNDASMIDAAYLNPRSASDVDWRIAGAGDFDRDGRVDLAWQHRTNGGAAIWLMDGLNLRNAITLDSLSDLAWKVAAVGDMNSDAYPDLIWQHTGTSNLVVWFMNGTSYHSSAPVSSDLQSSDSLKIVGTGDFNVDGSTDLLWQHVDGSLSVWLMSGVTRLQTLALVPSILNPLWKAVAVADYNKDGRADIVFQRNDGFLAMWFMKGHILTQATLLTPSVVGDTRWQVVGPR